MRTVIISSLLVFFSMTLHAQSRFEEEGDDKQSQTQTQPEPQQEANAQPKSQAAKPARQKSSFWDKTRFGGNLGLSFGTFTFINVSPRMYYMATEKLWIGAGLTFIYSKDNRDNLPPTYDPEQFVYGANLLATYQLIGPLFIQAEYEPLNFDRLTYIPGTDVYQTERIWVQGLFLGGGISQPIGRGMMFISALYNVTYTDSYNSYYAQPYVIRIGFGL